MPKVAKARKVGEGTENGVAVDVFELDAKTKDKDDKEIKFTYQFKSLPLTLSVEDVIKALTRKDSKGNTIDGKGELFAYLNTARKNEARSAKLNEINGILKIQEDPEAAIRTMVDQLVLAYGVPREMAEANVRATIEHGKKLAAENAAKSTAQPSA